MRFKSITQLGQYLVETRLAAPKQIEEIPKQLVARQNQPEQLLQIMQARGLLTSYQASQITAGEAEGLVLGDCKLMYKNASGTFARVFEAVR